MAKVRWPPMTALRPPASRPQPARRSLAPPQDPWKPTRWRTWFRWSMLLHPFRSREDGTMPAGMVLIVVVAGLLVAGALNADAILRKSNAKGDGWRNDLAHLTASISETFRFTALRDGVDSALGKNQTSDIDVADLLAEQEVEVDPAQVAAEAEAARIAALTPVLPAATPAAPLSVFVGGDSLARNFGLAMERVANASGVLTADVDSRAATGLARPDFFNWPEHLVRDVLPNDPDVVVLQFGGNDAQNIALDGKALERFSEPWIAEYRRRVGATMDLLRSPDNDRLVIWVGAPIMGPGAGVEGMDILNSIYWEEASTRPWVSYFDSWPLITDPDLGYVDRAPAADGSMVTIREPDKVHLTMAGGTWVAWGVLGRIAERADLTAGNLVPPPGESAPADRVPRAEIPA
jgi:hypothetical protein